MITPKNHPCFNDAAKHLFSRVHLPVAASCNVQCRYCNRKYDCANENRPGVTSAVLSPGQALYYLEHIIERVPSTSVVGIAGPGDAFAEPELTIETLALVHARFPELLLCVASNGLNAARCAEKLKLVGLTHITFTINAVSPLIGEKIYAWVRDGRKVLRGVEAAGNLIQNQIASVKAYAHIGIAVKINFIVIPTVNETHVGEVAAAVALAGAETINCIPLLPTQGTAFAGLQQPDHELMQKVRWEASQHLKVVRHCNRCRSDAAGLIGDSSNNGVAELLTLAKAQPIRPGENRPYVAVATREGMLVSEHLGQVTSVTVFGPTQNGYEVIDVRDTPPSGGGLARWRALATLLADCRALCVNKSGEVPRAMLWDQGIRVIDTDGLIVDALTAIYNGKEPQPVAASLGCSEGCGGGMGGCG